MYKTTGDETVFSHTSGPDLSFDPIDWQQLELLARLTPAQRVQLGIQAQAFARAMLRGTLRRRFPDLSQSELNMKVLAHFTPLRSYEEKE